MKCLSVRQPWAWSILCAGKDVENRTWPTSFRGRLLIHASCSFDPYGPPAIAAFRSSRASGEILDIPPQLPTGVIVGSVEVVDCVQSDDCESPWRAGPWCWLLRDPVAFARPIPYKGRLRLFEVPDEVLEGRTGCRSI